MSRVVSRIMKRRSFPATINGTEVHVRPLTHGEARVMVRLPDELQNPFLIGCCLVNADGSPDFPRNDGESDEDFARRVAPEVDGIDSLTWSEIGEAISKAGKVPPQEKLTKN